MAISHRHWLELLRRARSCSDPFAAAALYPHAAGGHREALAQRLFQARADCLQLAAAPFLPASVLSALAQRCAHDEMVLVRLARNPATPAHALAHVWDAARSARTCELLARHPNTPRMVLAALAGCNPTPPVLRALCENTGVAPELLADLERRHPAGLERLLAVNLATDARTLDTLWQSTVEPAVRAQILLHPACPARLLTRLPDGVLERRSLARQVRTSADLLARLAADGDAAVRRAAAAQAALPMAALLTLCFDRDAGVRRTIAGRADLPPRLVDWLLEDADVWVRRTVARNAACPVDRLTRLAGDAEADVRRGVARHPACPPELLERLSLDPVPWVQAGVAYRHDISVQLVRRLARSTDIDVLAGVAQQREVSPTRLAALARHDSPDVRRAVILNRHASRSVLLMLRKDGYALHRALLVDHPHLTDADRWRMRNDPDSQVRFRVFAHFARQAGEAFCLPRQERAAPLRTMETI
ncbi:hypothetical protein [Imbroritus primus]|uniref:hypothetical protein n=1 Tax=Imbroritus primus TaxID=3058603 RepID=UPI003D160C38